MATKFNRVSVEDFKTVFNSYFGPFADAGEFGDALFDRIAEKIDKTAGERCSLEDWNRLQSYYTAKEGFNFLYSKSLLSLNEIEAEGLEWFVIYLRFFFVEHRICKILNASLMQIGCTKKMTVALVELHDELRKAKLLPAKAGDLIFARLAPFFKQ